jgi:hypothetical protein
VGWVGPLYSEEITMMVEVDDRKKRRRSLEWREGGFIYP